jgi:hypothetical protein
MHCHTNSSSMPSAAQLRATQQQRRLWAHVYGMRSCVGKGPIQAMLGAATTPSSPIRYATGTIVQTPPPLPPPVTTKYACITTPNYHGIEYDSGTCSSATECEKECPPSLSSLLLGPAIEEEPEEDTTPVR